MLNLRIHRLIVEENEKTSPSIILSENRGLTKYISSLTSSRTSIVHQYSSNQIFEVTFNENNKQSERLSLYHHLTLSFRRSVHHENQYNKHIKKTYIESFDKKNNISINTQPTNFFQINSDEKYCHELFNQIPTLWFGSNDERRQVFDLLRQNQIKCTMLPEFIAHLTHSLSKYAIDIHDISIRKTMLYEALELSKIALISNENCALCHFSFKDKLNEASLFKYHMEKNN
ncbi:unnamed protein product [Rotaria sordida]|uniref:Uncharacterized protein n=1 Tax=Rotaria sordida TaxID=392033 RepID=A0A813SV41_9BILA|nr:unnamed protein product [Rotaria sordida]